MQFAQAIMLTVEKARAKASAPAKRSASSKRKAVPRAAAGTHEQKHPRYAAGDSSGKGGQFAPKQFASSLNGVTVHNLKTGQKTSIPAGQDPYEKLRVRSQSSERAFRGVQERTPKNLVLGGPGRQFEVGNRAEAIGLDWARKNINPSAVLLKQQGVADNFPFDMAAHVPGKGVYLYEVKGGQPSNSRGAWQWRVTVDQKLTAAELKVATTSARRDALLLRKQQEAHRRKEAVVKEIERQLREKKLLASGERLHVQTLGVIFDNKRQIADIHLMDDVHDRTAWGSPRAAQGYRGSFKFAIEKAEDATMAEVVREWGDRLEADLMESVPAIVAQIATMMKAKPDPGTTITKGELKVEKIDADQRYIAGWAMVTEVDGKEVVDRQGDVVGEDELTMAAHDFMRHYRVGKSMHQGDADQIEYTESMVFTKDVQKAMGIELGRVGWWLGGFATPETFAKVKKGEIKSFSIGGVGVRTKED